MIILVSFHGLENQNCQLFLFLVGAFYRHPCDKSIFFFAGIGLNVDNEKPTTCLNAVLQEKTSSHRLKREDILASFFDKFENLFEIFSDQGN